MFVKVWYDWYEKPVPASRKCNWREVNNELNTAQETANNPQNDPTMTAKKSVEKLPSSTDRADNDFVSSDVDNCINNYRRSEKQNAKKHLIKLQKDC